MLNNYTLVVCYLTPKSRTVERKPCCVNPECPIRFKQPAERAGQVLPANCSKSFNRGIDVLRENYVVYGDNVSRFFQSALDKAEMFLKGLWRVYYGNQSCKPSLHQENHKKNRKFRYKKSPFTRPSLCSILCRTKPILRCNLLILYQIWR